MEQTIFIPELRRRFQIPDAEGDSWCALCDAVVDCHNHHAEMCVARGVPKAQNVGDIVSPWRVSP